MAIDKKNHEYMAAAKYVFKCGHCGNAFGAAKSDAVSCSARCSNERWKENNPEKVRAEKQGYRARNHDRLTNYLARYRENNREETKARAAERRSSEKKKLAELEILNQSRVSEALALLAMVKSGKIIIQQAGAN